ncbi:MAG TPA: DNA alkylation repair protein [Plantibacter sp.]|uniref:DNA alkylation repair protein n=1 Tax=unclassified Plantibacter TaxID=2624265 RepID=UPI002BD93FB7|nr:DNA alkylation repair protein [Plantibacter sp.]
MPFADELLGAPAAQTLTRGLQQAAPGNPFVAVAGAADNLGELALRERADLLRDAILVDLPGDFASLATIVRAAAAADGSFSGWLIWPVASAVAARAVAEDTAESFDDAMQLQAELTGRLTAEFSIRTLLQHDLDRALPIVLEWTASDDEHVRRLASEGTRPYLPWAIRVRSITANPGVTVPILEALHRDPSEYVRRSVANHLNDLSRDHADLVVETATRWLVDPAPETPALVRHALRTLVKRGHPGALAVLGFTPTSTEVEAFTVDTTSVPFGGSVRFSATVRNTDIVPARLAIDYVVSHQKANGTQTSKTFKLTTQALAPGEHLDVAREHSFRAITTRRYYPGAHAVALQVNGILSEPLDFELLPPE